MGRGQRETLFQKSSWGQGGGVCLGPVFDAQDSHGGGTGGTKRTPTVLLSYGWTLAFVPNPLRIGSDPGPCSYLGISGPRSLFSLSEPQRPPLQHAHVLSSISRDAGKETMCLSLPNPAASDVKPVEKKSPGLQPPKHPVLSAASETHLLWVLSVGTCPPPPPVYPLADSPGSRCSALRCSQVPSGQVRPTLAPSGLLGKVP